MTTIAIDFGTSRTKLAYRNPADGRAELMLLDGAAQAPFQPSLVYLPRDGGAVRWGAQAEEMLEDDPGGVVDTLKRQFRQAAVRANGRRETPSGLLASLFRELRARVAAEVAGFGAPPDSVVLTRPALFGPAEEDVLTGAARDAGFTSIALLDEPVAAARAWLFAAGRTAEDVVVFDGGGGTIDWAWLRWDGAAFAVAPECPPGGAHVGGHDVDEALLERLKSRAGERAAAIDEARTRYLRTVRIWKERLGRGLPLAPVRIGGQGILLAPDEILGVVEETFVRQAVGSLLPYLERVRAARGGTLPPVLLVGGASRLPGLAQALEQRCACQTATWERSDYAIALGALTAEQAAPAEAPARPQAAPPPSKPTPPKPPPPQSPPQPKAPSPAEAAAELAAGGDRYFRGDGVPQSDAEAVRYWRLAADSGHAGALTSLAWMHAHGRGVAHDDAEAVRLYRQAAGSGEARAQFDLAWMLERGRGAPRDDAEAARLYRLAADQGHAGAQQNLGTMYQNGHGVPRDLDEAIRLYRQAAETGLATAQTNLGQAYHYGIGVERNDAEAARYYRLAAAQGAARAQNNLGELHQAGRGVERSEAEAIRLFQLAAAQDEPAAHYNLGRVYRLGLGMARDDGEAARRFRLAAEAGHANAQHELAAMLETGAGVPQDLAQAKRWYYLAADQGHEGARAALAAMTQAGQAAPRAQETVTPPPPPAPPRPVTPPVSTQEDAPRSPAAAPRVRLLQLALAVLCAALVDHRFIGLDLERGDLIDIDRLSNVAGAALLVPLALWIGEALGARIGPKLVMAGAGLLLASTGRFGLYPDFLFWRYYDAILAAGLIGNGVVFAVSVAIAVRWFPGQRGLALGLVSAGLALGEIVRHSPDMQSPSARLGVGGVVLLLGLALRFPTSDERAALAARRPAAAEPRLWPMRVAISPSAWLLYAILLLASLGGQVALYGGLQVLDPTDGENAAVAAAGGCVLLGWLSDRIGRAPAMVLAAIAGSAVFVLLGSRQRELFTPATSVVLLSWHALLALVAASSADWFGSRFAAVNGALLLTAPVLSLPIVANIPFVYGTLWNTSAQAIAGGLFVGAAALAFFVLRPLRRRLVVRAP